MRDFTDMTVIPASAGVRNWFIAVDGEGYNCEPFTIGNVQGSTRIIPSDRVLAMHWHGAQSHGHAEGDGAVEGFADRKQIEPYSAPWLKARAKAKSEAVDAILRKKQQMEELVTANKNASEALRSDIDAYPDRAVVYRQLLDNLVAEGERMKAAIPTDEQIAAARAEAEAAKREVDADT
jgi:hypothetical protein